MRKSSFLVACALIMFNCIYAQKLESVTWEDLFRVYRAEPENRVNTVLGLGFDFEKDYKNEKNILYHQFNLKLGSGLQGDWFEAITIPEGSRQVIYITENSTFFLELKAKLVNEYGFKENGISKSGAQIFSNDSALVEIKTVAGPPPRRLSQHKILIKRIPLTNLLVNRTQPKLDKSKFNYYALIIGIGDYEIDFNSLANPSKDATALANVLVNSFDYPKSNVTLLKDSVSREDIIKALEKYTTLKENDNLLIFFAGHGELVGAGMDREGYWLTSRSTKLSRSESISNNELATNIKRINAGHILVIADACFGGSLLINETKDENSIEKNCESSAEKFSRQYISSIGLEETPDASNFFPELMRILEDRKINNYCTESLYRSIRQQLKLAKVKPIYGRLNLPQDNYGEFLFAR